MRPDSPVAAETSEWLRHVDLDLRGAAVDMAAEPPLLEDVVFHCQQAVEKVLKAFLTWHEVSFRKTHNLNEVGAQCGEVDPSLALLAERARPLTVYAWKFRYPGGAAPPSCEEAERALTIAREVVEAVKARIAWPPSEPSVS